MGRLARRVRKYPWVAATLAIGLSGLGLLLAGQSQLSAWIVGLWAGIVALVQAAGMIRSLARGQFGLDVLAVTAITATLAVGDVWAALVVVLMLTGGEALEAFAAGRAKRELSALLQRSPQFAHRLSTNGEVRDVPVGQVNIGDALLVKPGELVPVDALVADESALFDESSITGESLPVTRLAGELVRSGAVNGDTAVRVSAAALAQDSQYQQIVSLVKSASDSRAPFVRLADRYAVPFTALALAIAGLAWWLSGEPARFAEVLVVATPCPLLIAAPVAFIGGMSRAARNGVIVKGGGTLEQLARVRTAAFDKTGTLTHGRPVVESVLPAGGVSATQLLAWAGAAEAQSPHVLARAIVTAAGEMPMATEVREITAHGVSAKVDGNDILVGKAEFIREHASGFVARPLEPGQMSVYVAVDGRFGGQIVLRDTLRDNAAETLERLRAAGVEHTVMLTGDAEATARHVAAEIGLTDVRFSLLPADKVAAVHSLSPQPVLMVGDGVNDAPVLAAADIGIAMGASGATAASDSADAVILVDDFARVALAVTISQRTIRIAKQSIWLGMVLSIGLMLVAAFGYIPAIIGATLQEAVDLATIFWSLRALREPRAIRASRTARPATVAARAS